MTSSQTQLARRRLWLGISNVGFWVLVAGFGLCWLAGNDGEMLGPGLIFLVGGGVVAVQAIFDFIGGMTLMPGPRRSLPSFLASWAVGVMGHTLVLIGIGFLSVISLRFTGGFSLGILVSTFFLAITRRQLALIVGGVSSNRFGPNNEVIIAEAPSEPAFTGGIVGLGGRAKSLLPGAWARSLPDDQLEVESRRRQWQIKNGLPARVLVLLLLWNLAGAFVGDSVFSFSDRAPCIALLGYGCWMTLWAFFSLLVLPVLSRGAVFDADRASFDSGLDPRAWISNFSDLVGEDGSSQSAAQAIFYPIPSVKMRLGKVLTPFSGLVLGDLARTNLYFSLATFTFLGRAVHCNVGRPALWIFPPAA